MRLKVRKGLCIIGSSLLLIMAIFHGIGFNYVSDKIKESNAEDFLKDIVPVLFAHPSIHLMGLAAIGILILFLGKESWKMSFLLSLLILIDALLAFYLGGMIPGLLLLTAAFCFITAGYSLKQNKTDSHKH